MPQTVDHTRLAELDGLTREYAHYSRSAGGWSAVAGGLLFLASFAAGTSSSPSAWLRWTLVAVPFVWLITRALITRGYYQRWGRVGERAGPEERQIGAWLLAGISLVVLVVLLGPAVGFPFSGERATHEYKWLYVLIVACIPVAGWLWLHTPLDVAVGTALFCQAALAAVESRYPFASSAAVVIPAALLMVGVGLRDHSRFRELRRRIRTFQDANGMVE